MVTHDIALKHYATKVVRMVDGKINKIEENTLENRQEHIQALKRTVEEYKEKDKAVNQENLGVREGI